MKVKESAIRKVGKAMKVSISRASSAAPGKGTKERISARTKPRRRQPALAASAIHGVDERVAEMARAKHLAESRSENPPASPVKAWRAIRTRDRRKAAQGRSAAARPRAPLTVRLAPAPPATALDRHASSESGWRRRVRKQRSSAAPARGSAGSRVATAHHGRPTSSDEMLVALPEHVAQTCRRSGWHSPCSAGRASDAAGERRAGDARPQAPRREATHQPHRRRRGPHPVLPSGASLDAPAGGWRARGTRR